MNVICFLASLMSVNTSQFTAEQLAAMQDDGQCYELVDGELLIMSPAGNEHGQIAAVLCTHVGSHILNHKLGTSFAAETGFLIGRNPDTVRAPDFAFITQQRMDEVGPVAGYWPGAPDLVAEVVSSGDKFSHVESKSLQWLSAGTKVVWVVDPRQRHVTVYRSRSDIQVLEEDAELHEPILLPCWRLRVGDLFPAAGR